EESRLAEFFKRAESLFCPLVRSLAIVNCPESLHCGGFTTGLQTLKQLGYRHSGQNCDDRNHDQQFDKRETRLRATESSLALHKSFILLPGLNVRALQGISIALLKRWTIERVPNITTEAAARESRALLWRGLAKTRLPIPFIWPVSES